MEGLIIVFKSILDTFCGMDEDEIYLPGRTKVPNADIRNRFHDSIHGFVTSPSAFYKDKVESQNLETSGEPARRSTTDVIDSKSLGAGVENRKGPFPVTSGSSTTLSMRINEHKRRKIPHVKDVSYGESEGGE
jgi:hypothetical protein